MGEELTKEKVESYKGDFFGGESPLFKIEENDICTLNEKFDIIDENAFNGEYLGKVFKEKEVKKMNFNKINLIRRNAFKLFNYEEMLEIYFDPEDSNEGIKIEEGAFEDFKKVDMMSGFDSKKVSLMLYKESFGNGFYESLVELKNLSMYLRGDGWEDEDIKAFKERGKENFEVYDREYNLVIGEGLAKEDASKTSEAKVDAKKDVEAKGKPEVNEKKYKTWDEIVDKDGMISFVIDQLVEKEFRIKADVDIDKAIETDGEIKLPKQCFVDIKLVSASGGIVEVLKLLSKERKGKDDELLQGDPKNRNLVKNAVKEYIKGHWDKVIKTGIEYNVKIVKGNVEEKIKDEGARKKFLDENNAGSGGVKGVDDVKEYIYDIVTKKVEEINQQDIKNIIKNVSIIAKESKKEDKKLYDLCKTCVGYMRKAMTNKGE